MHFGYRRTDELMDSPMRSRCRERRKLLRAATTNRNMG